MPKRIILSDINSFAVEDLKAQAEKIINVIIKNNSFSLIKKNALLDLQKSILTNSPMDSLDHYNNDTDPWNKIMNMGSDKRFWFDNYHHGLVVSYFHRLILDKIDYFKSGNDPYERIKKQALMEFVENCLPKGRGGDIKIEQILMGMLWGNKTDFVPHTISSEKILLKDDRKLLIEFLFERKPYRIDIIADNIGEELFYDILFINYLFAHDLVKVLRYHVKNYPYNISDATKQDVFWTLNFLAKTNDNSLRNIAENILNLISDRGLAMNVVDKQYAGSSLIITKGDFNYRKNIGWYYWNIKNEYKEIISYLKSPLVSFRVIKNEILVGLKNKALIDTLNREDPDWWKKGKGGVIMLAIPKNDNNHLKRNIIEDFWAQTL